MKAAAALVFGLLLLGALVALPSARADSGWDMQFYLLPQYGNPVLLSDNVSGNSTILVNVTLPSSFVNPGPRQVQIFDDTALQLRSYNIGTLNSTTAGSHRVFTVNLRSWVYQRDVVFTFGIFDQNHTIYEFSKSLLVHVDIGLALAQQRNALLQQFNQIDSQTRLLFSRQIDLLNQSIAQLGTALTVVGVLLAACLVFTFLRVIKRVPWLEKEKNRSDAEVLMRELMESSDTEIRDLIASAKERVSQVDDEVLERRVKAILMNLIEARKKSGA